MATERGNRKEFSGTVVRARTAKTVVVEVRAMTQHPRYHKFVRTRRRLVAHDEKGTCRTGDRVRIAESRPLSRTKRWRVVQVLARAEAESANQ